MKARFVLSDKIIDCKRGQHHPMDDFVYKDDVKEFIRLLKEKATKRIELNYNEKPRKDDEDFAYCGGCDRFVIEEGCTCGMINISIIDKLAGDKLI